MTVASIDVAEDSAPGREAQIHMVMQRRRRVSLLLAATILSIWLGFLLLMAYGREFLALQLTDGLTVALVLGELVIVCAWLVTAIYVVWANRYHDAACDRILGKGSAP